MHASSYFSLNNHIFYHFITFFLSFHYNRNNYVIITISTYSLHLNKVLHSINCIWYQDIIVSLGSFIQGRSSTAIQYLEFLTLSNKVCVPNSICYWIAPWVREFILPLSFTCCRPSPGWALDSSVQLYRSHTRAPVTQHCCQLSQTHLSQTYLYWKLMGLQEISRVTLTGMLRAYLKFCSAIGRPPLPLSPANLYHYAVYLTTKEASFFN